MLTVMQDAEQCAWESSQDDQPEFRQVPNLVVNRATAASFARDRVSASRPSGVFPSKESAGNSAIDSKRWAFRTPVRCD